ncbi:hypothetical protein C8F04DRAFT_1064214, partial [Mycena alexandri]
MSYPSVSKHGFAANIGIYRVPPHLSWDEFKAAFEASLDAMVRTPVVQRSRVKIEMMTHTDSLDEHVKLAGFPPQQRCMMIATQTETPEDFAAVKLMRDPEMAAEFKRAGDLGLLDGSSAFSVDVVPKAKVDSSEATTEKSVHAIGIHKVPPHLSEEQYTQKFHAFVDKLIAVPAARQNLIKYELWLSNPVLKEDFLAVGVAGSEPVIVVRAQSKTLDDMIECMRDEEFTHLMLDAGGDFGFTTAASLFNVDIVVKVDTL